jgi:adenylosuccinate synthase
MRPRDAWRQVVDLKLRELLDHRYEWLQNYGVTTIRTRRAGSFLTDGFGLDSNISGLKNFHIFHLFCYH